MLKSLLWTSWKNVCKKFWVPAEEPLYTDLFFLPIYLSSVFNRVFNRLSTGFEDKMLISTESVNRLAERISGSMETFCSGLFLSARWFVVSQLDHDGIQLIVLPDKDSAEYCAADLYNLIEGDKVFFLPDSGKSLEKSNYKSSLGVQRTSAIGKIMEYKEGQQIIYL